MARPIGGVLLIAVSLSGYAAESDALAISSGIRAKHLPYGTMLDPVHESADSQVVNSYSRAGDSAIWTGHWLAAESYRWAVTRSPEALENVRLALDGIRRLVDVTGTDVLARCAIPADSAYFTDISQEESRHGINYGIVDGKQWMWIGNTSRDQYSGVFFGLTVAFNEVDDAQVQGSVNSLATRMLDSLRAHGWAVRMPDGRISTTFVGRADQQLALLKLGRRTNAGRFATAYRLFSTVAAPQTILPVSLEVLEPHESYFKFNLDYINFYDLLTSGDSSWARANYKQAYDILRRTTDGHGNAFFNMVDRAISGAEAARDSETIGLLEEWLKRPRRDPWVDWRGKLPSCEQEDRACEVIAVVDRVRTDFLWQRSPFLLYGGGQGKIETAGIDYILPYWMARYYGVIQ